MEDKISILIADDHPVFRNGLKEVIESHNRFHIVAEAENGEMALKQIEKLNPGIAILDIDMPLMNGFDVIRAIRGKNLSTDVIILTMYKEEDMFNGAMELGVKGYLLKESAVQDIIECIHAVASGNFYISPFVSSYLINRNERMKSFLHKHPSLVNLTPTEKLILKLIGENKTSREIADQLCVSSKTVENHRTNIANKLEIHGSHNLLKFAIENKQYL